MHKERSEDEAKLGEQVDYRRAALQQRAEVDRLFTAKAAEKLKATNALYA